MIVQIEHIEAVNNIDAIFSVKGIDAFIVGPYDLSGSLGKPGRFEDRDVIAAMNRIRQAARRHKIPAGFHVIPPSPTEVNRRLREGYTFLAVSLDTLFLGSSCRAVMKDIHHFPTRG